MENGFSIRHATEADRDELTSMRYATLQNRYQGYLPEQNFKKLNRAYAAKEVDEWLQNSACQIGILSSAKGRKGYVACVPDTEMQDWGLILDAGDEAPVSTVEMQHLLQWADSVLKSKGCRQTHIWVLQDNLRGRFMVENFGFKQQKELKLVQEADYTLTVRHYIL